MPEDRRNWDKWVANEIIKVSEAEDPPAEAWSAWLYCRKAIPKGMESFRNERSYQVTQALWASIAEIVAELDKPGNTE